MPLLGCEECGELGFHQNLIGGHHGNHIPRANLSAKFASDADVEVDGTNPHRITGLPGVGNMIDAIDWTNGHTGVASGAHVLVEDGELLG